MIELSNSDLAAVWQAIYQRTDYRWPIGQSSAAKLAMLTSVVNAGSSRDELSAALSPMLVSDDANRAAQWIIRDWGGIRRTSDTSIEQMVIGFRDYSIEAVNDFISEHGCNRISSWSKLLAFQNTERWAIYDSRTAVALNVALMSAGRDPCFEMPLSRNKTIKPKHAAIRAEQNHRSLVGYLDYLSVLNALKVYRNLQNIGQVEMILFANAEAIVNASSR
ncbi:hypothetical protein [Sphingomonas sp.]|uniref:hypothetical protein n=1 Tax=Sphingomonas sp. TaxID=28214 RepID=UPI001EC29423|nr:hypothetical protein [Sphingomonas sp.]MBX3593547.1 hypothetical protein [Sphingomonas sp.]